MKKETKLESLRMKAQKAQNAYREAEEEEKNKTSIPVLRKSVGKCFKFINSYGGDYQRWPLYIKIVSFDEKAMTFNTVEFQKTSMEIAEAKLERRWNFRGQTYFNNSSYIEIPKSEYERAKKNFKKLLLKILQ